MEQRRTQQFLKYALGKREKKTEQELSKELREKSYNPVEDPFLPRLKRKVGHLTGGHSQMTSTTSRRNNLSARVGVFDNHDSINSIKKEKYAMVKNPLRTKMSTITKGNSRSYLVGVSNTTGGNYAAGGPNNPERMLKDLK